MLETFRVFLRLGLTAFGGPVAHLAYFREAFVVQRRWLSEARFAEIVALSQFLPGPASSQTGMAIGMLRAGWPGLLAAWVAFTLPSALLLFGFAWLVQQELIGAGGGWLSGVKAAVAAVVAHALFGMARSLLRLRAHWLIAVAAATVMLLQGGVPAQLGVIGGSAALGLLLREQAAAPESPPSGPARDARAAVFCLLGFAALLAALPLAPQLVELPGLAVLDRFYRAGSLVFGGGHVVLPLLHSEVVTTGWVSNDDFLAGYAAAQAVPGPLFAFSAYLGAVMQGGGAMTAVTALLGIFLPSILLVGGVLPFWERLRAVAPVRRAVGGVNAGVVGLLAAVLWNPVLVEGVGGPASAGIAAAGLALLLHGRTPAWMVVLLAAVGGSLLFPD